MRTTARSTSGRRDKGENRKCVPEKVRLFYCLRSRAVPGDRWRAHRWQAREDRAVPGDTWRAHFASPRRASRSFCLRGFACAVYSVCALTFAGMYSLNPSFFCPSGRDPRGFRGQPLGDHRRPRPFPPWESTLNVRTLDFLAALLNGILPVLFCDKRVYRKTARWINRAITKMSGSGSKWLAQRRRCSLNVLALSTPSRQGVHSELSGLDRTPNRCTFAGTSLTRKIASSALSVLFSSLAS